MVDKWTTILDYLVLHNKISFQQLEHITGNTLQTNNKLINLLNKKMENIATIMMTENSYELILDDYDALKNVISKKLKSESDFNSSSKRRAYIILKLSSEDRYIQIDEFLDEITVSRGTINKDIKKIRQDAQHFSIDIHGIPNKGLKLEGSEFSIRLFLLYHVYDYYPFTYQLENDVITCIDDIAQKYRLNLEESVLLTKITGITISRCLRGYNIDNKIPYFIKFEFDSEKVNTLFRLIQEQSVSITENDFEFLLFPLNTRNSSYIKNEKIQENRTKVCLIFNKVADKIEDVFSIGIDRTFLFDEIKYHLMFLLNRVYFHVELQDIFSGEIEKKYSFAFEIAKVAAKVIEENVSAKVNNSEVSYLAIYFQLAIIARNKELLKIAIICNTGKATSLLIERQLKLTFDEDVEISHFSEIEYESLDFTKFSIVFTTIPIFVPNDIPVIKITSLFDNDILFNKINLLRNQFVNDNKLIDISNFKLNSFQSYQDNIKFMINHLTAEKKLDKSFLALWEKREKLHSTIFDEGIALPHAINKKAKKVVFSIGIFDKPIMNNNQKIDLIFLIGVPEKTNDKVEKKLIELYDLIFCIAHEKVKTGNLSLEKLMPINSGRNFESGEE